MSDERTQLLQQLETERQRPVPPPPRGACDEGPTAHLMRLKDLNDPTRPAKRKQAR